MTTQRRYVAVPDGEEHWFLDETWTNRMVLALRSGVHDEVSWSLYRLLTLSSQHGARFFLKPLPGLTDALFEWPLWWVKESGGISKEDSLLGTYEFWSMDPDVARKRKYALESLLILRNASFNETNATHLMASSKTFPLLTSIRTLTKDDFNCEFIAYCIEILHAIASRVVLPPPGSPLINTAPPIDALQDIMAKSNDRTLLLASMSALTLLLNNSANSSHISSTSPCLNAAIRFLPLTADRPLLMASLDYLFTHLSHTPAAKSFMHHPEMPNTIKLLAIILHAEQVKEPKTVAIGPPALMAPPEAKGDYFRLTAEEIQTLVETPEPQRSLTWIAKSFIFAPGEEETQVTFWTSYRETFTPFADACVGGMATAQDVIKNVMNQFPKALAIVVPGPPQRFIIRNVKRRQREGAYLCRWKRSQCSAEGFQTVDDLLAHVLGHLEGSSDMVTCEWATCQHTSLSPTILKPHVLTHVPPNPSERHPGQPIGITLPHEPFPHPSPNPTLRPPPPPPSALLHYEVPLPDPPSTSLTALLVLRLLFRTAFSELGPPPPGSDENRFGFPMPPSLAEGMAAVGHEHNRAVKDAMQVDDQEKLSEAEGQQKGRAAFMLIATLLSGIQMGDELPATWIAEMLDAVMMDAMEEAQFAEWT